MMDIRIRSVCGFVVFSERTMCANSQALSLIVPSMLVALAKFVSVKSARPGAGTSTNQCAFLTIRYSANACAGSCRSGHGKFIAVFLPECAIMASMPSGLRRRNRPRRKE
jgi:hypothetical protein